MRITLWVTAGFVLLFLITPTFVIIPLSFSSGSLLTYPLPGFSLQWYERLFTDAHWLRAIKNSFVLAFSTAALATAIGVPAAIGLSFGRIPFKPAIMALVLSPVVVPIIIIAVGIFYAFAPLGLVNTRPGLILAHTVLATPFVIITVSAGLARFDQNLLRAAASLGATPIRTFLRVILPLTLPATVTGALFAFITSFDEVVVTLFLAGPEQQTLPRQMFEGIREYIDPLITAVATLFAAMTALILLMVELLRSRQQGNQDER